LQSYILWEKAQVAIHYNDLDLAMNLYERLVKDYPKDVLADKTLFAMAEIHHFSKQDKETAMKLYLRLLMDYPASLYKVEARKRIRELRGDGGS
jgi:TolA-binding protein